MPMNKKLLKFSTIALICVGMFAACSPFISSLNPSDKQINKALHVDVSVLATGETQIYDSEGVKIYITKLSEKDEYSVVSIPYINGVYRMPEFDWTRPLLPCSDFGIIEVGRLGCKDNASEFWWSYMQWSVTGEYLGEKQWGHKIPELLKPKFVYKNGSVILLGV